MSGTSLDGVDAALLDTDGEELVQPGLGLTLPYDSRTRGLLRDALNAAQKVTRGGAVPSLIGEAERILTAAHADAVRALLKKADLKAGDVSLIGFHGQTILHRPAQRWTWQIGDGALLAQLSGIDVVNDFRSADVAAGGQGAPLMPLYHAALAHTSGLKEPLVVVNIGGVAQVTYISGDQVLAFDTGPGNAPIDDWCARRAGARFDAEGALAAAGKVDRTRLERFSEHRFFARKPPKSLDRGDFTDSWAEGLGVADGAATLTRGTARAIALGARHFPAPVTQWIICGGGARNPTLLRAIAEETRGSVTTGEALGWNGDAIEAQAFGFLAVRSLRGLPLTFPTTTGAPRPLSGGRVHLP
jgi:anhydro-N-acetylmuramic acid kinase